MNWEILRDNIAIASFEYQEEANIACEALDDTYDDAIYRVVKK